MRTKKPEGAKDWSWRERPYLVNPFCDCDIVHGRDIFPGVLDQGKRYTCGFCAMISVGQTELNREIARAGGDYKFRLVWESLVTKFLELNGLQPEGGPAARNKLEEDLLGPGGRGSVYDQQDGIAWCFKHLGVEAVYSKEEAVSAHAEAACAHAHAHNEEVHKEAAGSTHHLTLHDYKCYENMSAKDVKTSIEEGRAIRVSILVGSEFHMLKPGEIYAWCPDIRNRKWVQKPERPGRHAIALLGNGDTGPELDHLQFHPFLNSHGKEYGDGGMGCVFYKSLIGPFYLLEMKAKPKMVKKTLSQLKSEGVPPPRLAPGKSVYVRPPRGYGFPTPPGGRASINSNRWKD